MNEGSMKKLFFIGLAIEIITDVILIGIVIYSSIVKTYFSVPEFVIVMLWIGIVISIIASVLSGALKRKELRSYIYSKAFT